MAKDDIDSFVTDMKTFASILGHNDDVVMEKFKDVFPDKNIDSALIGIINFNNMQAKAKQLVQIYCLNYTNDCNSLGACLMHTHKGDTPSAKPKVVKLKVTNQHQLVPAQNTGPSKQGNPHGQTRGGYKNNNNPGSRQGQNNDDYYHQNNFRDSTHGSSGRGARGHSQKPWHNNNTNDRGQDSQGQTSQRGRGGNQSRGRGCGYNSQQGQQQTYTQIYQPSQGTYPYMAPLPMPLQNLIQPPPYDPNW